MVLLGVAIVGLSGFLFPEESKSEVYNMILFIRI